MRKIIALLLILFLHGLLFAQASTTPPKRPLVLEHVTVIDVTGAPSKSDMTVIVTDNRITAVGKTGKVRAPRDAQTIDATGKFLIPGLWDMHVHWYRKDYLPLFIANGVTGVRQMNGNPTLLQWRQEVANGKLLGPRMVIASPIVDGPKAVHPNSVRVGSGIEAREAVKTIKRSGYDFVKVYNFVPREAYFALADEAKMQGLSFVGHTPYSVSVAEASDAGQKSIEHLAGVFLGCATEEARLRKTVIEEVIDPKPSVSLRARLRAEMKATESYDNLKATELFAHFINNGTWQVPTLTALRSTAFMDDARLASDVRLKYLPTIIRARLNPQDNPFTNAFTAEDYANFKRLFRKQVGLVAAMHRAGLAFLAGTDTSEILACFPGFSLHDELALLVQAGFTPMEALQAATLNPARFLGKEKEIGAVEKGKLADLVLLDANPLQDINNTQKINAVIIGGKLIPKSELHEMLAKVEAAAREN